MSAHKTKQQRAILVVALLGIRRLQNRTKPERKHVLAFIRIKKLMNWDEREIDWQDDYCLVGENRISWRRKDFVQEGLIVQGPGTASWGFWELSISGLEIGQRYCERLKEIYEQEPDFFDQFKAAVPEMKLTERFLNLALQLAYNDFSKSYYSTRGRAARPKETYDPDGAQ